MNFQRRIHSLRTDACPRCTSPPMVRGSPRLWTSSAGLLPGRRFWMGSAPTARPRPPTPPSLLAVPCNLSPVPRSSFPVPRHGPRLPDCPPRPTLYSVYHPFTKRCIRARGAIRAAQSVHPGEPSVHRVPTITLAALLALAAAGAQAQQAPATPGQGPGGENPRIHEIVRAVQPSRIESDVRTLAGFGTRHTLSDTTSATRGIGAARRWIYDEFQRISRECGGCLEVQLRLRGHPRQPAVAHPDGHARGQRGRHPARADGSRPLRHASRATTTRA